MHTIHFKSKWSNSSTVKYMYVHTVCTCAQHFHLMIFFYCRTLWPLTATLCAYKVWHSSHAILPSPDCGALTSLVARPPVYRALTNTPPTCICNLRSAAPKACSFKTRLEILPVNTHTYVRSSPQALALLAHLLVLIHIFIWSDAPVVLYIAFLSTSFNVIGVI